MATKRELIREHNQKVIELKNAGKDRVINMVILIFMALAVVYFGIHYVIYLVRFNII